MKPFKERALRYMKLLLRDVIEGASKEEKDELDDLWINFDEAELNRINEILDGQNLLNAIVRFEREDIGVDLARPVCWKKAHLRSGEYVGIVFHYADAVESS